MDPIVRPTPIIQSSNRVAASRRRAQDAHLGAVLRELSSRPRLAREGRRPPATVVAARTALEVRAT